MEKKLTVTVNCTELDTKISALEKRIADLEKDKDDSDSDSDSDSDDEKTNQKKQDITSEDYFQLQKRTADLETVNRKKIEAQRLLNRLKLLYSRESSLVHPTPMESYVSFSQEFKDAVITESNRLYMKIV